MEYLKNLEKAQQAKKRNQKLSRDLKRMKPKALDEAFHDLHDEVFERIECLNCANCCSTTSPIFRDVDIDRIAKHLNMSSAEFVEKNLKLDHEGDYVLRSSPCLFLGEDKFCSIYEVRPKACREYPHTDRKNMHQILDLTFQNSLICPAVAGIFESLALIQKK